MSDDQDIEEALRRIQADPLFQRAEKGEMVVAELEHSHIWRQIQEMAEADEREAIEKLLKADLFDRQAQLHARMNVMLARAIPAYIAKIVGQAKADRANWQLSEAVDI